MPLRPREGVEVQIYPFFNLGARSGQVVDCTRRPLYPQEREPVPIYRGLGGLQGLSGMVRNISPPPGFDPRPVQALASRYTHYEATNAGSSIPPYTSTAWRLINQRNKFTFTQPLI